MPLAPSPSAPPLAQTVRWIFRPIGFFQRSQEQFGDVFAFTAPPIGRITWVNRPDHVKQVLTMSPDQALRPVDSPLRPVLGPESTLVLNGQKHLSRRKLLLPPFHGQRMRAYGELMAEATNREIDSWPLHTPFRLHDRMQDITLEVIERAVFGVEEESKREQLGDAIKKLLAATGSIRQVATLARNFGKVSASGQLGRLVAPVDDALYDEIRTRREADNLEERSDILSMLLLARYEDGSGLTDEELRDELVTLLLAGHETTATSLAWTFERLTRTPAALDRLTEEVASGERAYLDAVIKETLRIRPVVPAVAREMTEATEIGGFEIPAGSWVGLAIYLAHRRPESFPDPYAFKPERFIDAKPETYSWIPFGGGVRRCLGAAFAEFEMAVVISEMLKRVTLEATSQQGERMRRRNVTVVPSEGATVVMTSRRPQLRAAPEPIQAAA